ncbi:MAG: hypothetical protein ACREFQ_10015 [Stellaceae bacterium]
MDRKQRLIGFIEHYRRELVAGVRDPAIASALKHDIAMAQAEVLEMELLREPDPLAEAGVPRRGPK